jgi:uncharacterized protein (DUF58 family)
VIHPTPRAAALAAAGFPVALLPALVRPGLWGLWLSFAALSAFAFGLDAILGVPAGRLRAAVEVPARLAVGVAGGVRVRLAAPRAVRRLTLLLDLHQDLEPVPPRTLSLPAGETAVEVPLRARRRGLPTVDALWCRWTGPLGLAGRRLRLEVGRPVEVVPDLAAVRASAIRAQGPRELAAGAHVERYLGDGSEFDALVEYVPGLDPRAISWKASAPTASSSARSSAPSGTTRWCWRWTPATSWPSRSRGCPASTTPSPRRCSSPGWR